MALALRMFGCVLLLIGLAATVLFVLARTQGAPEAGATDLLSLLAGIALPLSIMLCAMPLVLGTVLCVYSKSLRTGVAAPSSQS